MAQIQIEQIRYELTWRIRHASMYPDFDFEIVKLEDDPEGMHFGLYVDDYIKSVISLFNQGSAYQFRKFATLPAAQGLGYGTMLLQYVIEDVKERGATKLWCNARISASSYYECFGFVKTSENYTKNGIDYIVMELLF